MQQTLKRPELLAPVGDITRLNYAIEYGADAVYLAYKQFGMRAAVGNFDIDELSYAVELCHKRGVKVYVTVNTYPTVEETEQLQGFFTEMARIGPDAFIIADIGVMSMAKIYAPNIDIHVSTQANVTNALTALEYVKLGAKRIVLAREVSLEDIRAIKKAVGETEIECFVHGAMCMSVSGRCHLSAFLTGRDANRGACAQPCRWQYTITEMKREGEFFPVEQDGKGTYIFNSKDMCMVEHIDDLIKAGVDSFKIEGRMKTAYYVACTVKAYKMAIDEYFEKGDYDRSRCLAEAQKASHRDFSTGFYYAPMGADGFNTFTGGYVRTHELIATVEGWEDGVALIRQKNKFSVGDTLEILSPEKEDVTFTVERITTLEGEDMPDAPHPEQLLHIPCKTPLSTMDILRRKTE
ncbi:MAG: U32 family peptidase [Clostridia bacterium]|nr:U32 family peptidase [Clostridia bacterium]